MTTTIFTVLSVACLVVSLFKYRVVRDCCRDPHGGGGCPVIDFPIVYPLFLSISTCGLLESIGLYPFPLYIVLLALTLVVIYAVIFIHEVVHAPIASAVAK